MRKKEDLRVIKTRKSLYKGLLDIMKNKPFDEIKVSDICNKASINRSTFYDHYNDKYELFHSLIEDQREELLKNIETNESFNSIKDYCLEIIKLFLIHIKSEQKIFSLIIKNNFNSEINNILNSGTIDIFTKYINDNYINESNIKTETIVSYIMSGATNICLNEITNNPNYDIDKIIDTFDKLIYVPDFFTKKTK